MSVTALAIVQSLGASTTRNARRSLQSVAADVQIAIGTSFVVVGVSFAVADVVSGGMTSRVKMSVLRRALIPVFAAASPHTPSAAAFTVVVVTPSAPVPAPAFAVAA